MKNANATLSCHRTYLRPCTRTRRRPRSRPCKSSSVKTLLAWSMSHCFRTITRSTRTAPSAFSLTITSQPMLVQVWFIKPLHLVKMTIASVWRTASSRRKHSRHVLLTSQVALSIPWWTTKVWLSRTPTSPLSRTSRRKENLLCRVCSLTLTPSAGVLALR